MYIPGLLRTASSPSKICIWSAPYSVLIEILLFTCKNTAIFSVGSDGTDGPTDAAGGYCDENTKEKLQQAGLDVYEVLKENDAYHALKKTGGLIITGATGTNVNDVAVVLIRVS